MKAARAAVLLIACTLLAACQVTLTLPPYVPISTDEVSGSLDVAEFNYRPRPSIAPTEIRENAAGQIFITQPVGDYVTNAIRREFRQAGAGIRSGGHCRLTGDIFDFAIESLGYSSTYLSDFGYTLSSPDGSPVLHRRIANSFTTSKFVTMEIILASLQKSISDNVGKFIGDSEVRAMIERRCVSPAIVVSALAPSSTSPSAPRPLPGPPAR